VEKFRESQRSVKVPGPALPGEGLRGIILGLPSLLADLSRY
jgi:hypothetical protein